MALLSARGKAPARARAGAAGDRAAGGGAAAALRAAASASRRSPLGLTGEAQPGYESARKRLGWPAEERVLLFLSRLHVKKGLRSAPRRAGDGPSSRPRYAAGHRRRWRPGICRHLRTLTRKITRARCRGSIGSARCGARSAGNISRARICSACRPHSENFGLAVLEACQVGTPVLTTVETPWAQELADERGYICAPRMADVREALTRYFASEPWTQNARTALSEWAWTRFHWDALAERYAAFYRSVTAPGGGR